MLILGLETSCDETAAAVVKDGKKILSNVFASSEALHKKSGGIIPEVAAREQARWIVPVLDEALKLASSGRQVAPDRKTVHHKPRHTSQIDAIAVTVGPGLIGSLLVGVEAAKTLAFTLQKPIIPINHLLAHFYAAWLESAAPEFPLIGLLASGGHTDLVLMKDHGKYTWLGGTRDDAAGECFDKTARLLGLSYPGGPAIEKAASSTINHPRQGRVRPLAETINHLPRPMLDRDNFDFSFSGLKTAVLRTAQKTPPSPAVINELASEIQEAITDVLVKKTLQAAERYQVKTIIVAGGVAANKRLREKFQLSVVSCQLSVKLFVPPPRLCADNAAIVASCAFFNSQPIPWQKIQADASLSLDS